MAESVLKRPLTAAEIAIIKQLAIGFTNKEIAVRMNLSTKTVETHRANIFRKLHTSNVAQLVHYALRAKLIELLPMSAFITQHACDRQERRAV